MIIRYKASDPRPEFRAWVLFWGAPGTQKTRIAGRAPRALVLDFDMGGEVIDAPDTEIVRVPFDPTAKVATAWLEGQAALREAIARTDIEWIVLDSLSARQDHALQKALLDDPPPKGFISPAHWGQVQGLLLKDIDLLHRSGKHIIAIAHEYHKEIRNLKQEVLDAKLQPLVSGQLGERIGHQFGEVYRFVPKEHGAVQVVTRSNKENEILFRCKSRLGVPELMTTEQLWPNLLTAIARKQKGGA